MHGDPDGVPAGGQLNGVRNTRVPTERIVRARVAVFGSILETVPSSLTVQTACSPIAMSTGPW